jgi:hypothetical protein
MRMRRKSATITNLLVVVVWAQTLWQSDTIDPVLSQFDLAKLTRWFRKCLISRGGVSLGTGKAKLKGGQ